MNKQKKRNFWEIICYTFVILCYMLLVIFSPFIGSLKTANAENIVYSNVLADLQKDENFNANDFPVDEEDHSLKVIQIAESAGKELFVYVYQPNSPNSDLQATTIRFSTSIGDNLSPRDYNLTLLNANGVFYKYKVNDFVVKEDVVRYYEIIALHRKWNEKYDEPTGNDNIIEEVAFEIGQQWTACTLNGETSYTCNEIETILITEKYVDHLRYTNGWAWVTYYCDSHYVAFSTDKPMDEIVEAELSFVAYEYTTLYDSALIDPEDRDKTKDVKKHVVLTNEEEVENKKVGLFGEHHDWNRIESVSDFIKNEDLTKETKANLENKQWVLRFYETEYSHTGGNLGNMRGHGTGVAEVTILRLKFQHEGVTYNLGVIDNKQTGDNTPGNVQKSLLSKIMALLTGILLAIVLLVGIVLLSIFTPFLSVVWKIVCLVAKAIWCVLKGLWWLISAPFTIFKK